LREDLILQPGPLSADGAPSWNLYDPVAHRFFRLGWVEFEILSHWSLADPVAIAAAISRETSLHVDPAEVEAFQRFADVSALFVSQTPSESRGLFLRYLLSRRFALGTWILHNYLYMRIPLINPQAWLNRTLPYVRWIYTRAFLIALLTTAALGLYLVSRQWSQFTHSFLFVFTPEGFLATGCMMGLAKVVHEFGHAYAAALVGCRVPRMGVALMVFCPVLWTDATDAWKLPRRRDRLLIDGGGMLAELTLAVLASVAWAMLPDGPIRTGTYLLASTSWIATLAVNLNPFMRFDGYFLLGDWWDEPNLQERSFALARWWLREQLFRPQLPPPEHLALARRRLLVAYALGTWIYRFFLFMGLAVLVYYYFFKALGIFLMLVEVVWFILRPIWNEVLTWVKMRSLFPPGTGLRVGTLLISILALGIIPWSSDVLVPALTQAASEHTVFAPEAGIVAWARGGNGATIAQGEPVLRLTSPDLDYKIDMASRRLRQIKGEIASQTMEAKLVQKNPVNWEEMETIAAELQGYLVARGLLELKSPFAGEVTDQAEWLRIGAGVEKGEILGMIIRPGPCRIVAYVPEVELHRIQIGREARFFPDNGSDPAIPLVVASMSPTATRILNDLELASIYGGGLGVRQDQEGKLVPEQSVYRFLLAPLSPMGAGICPRKTGQVRLSGAPEGLFVRIWRMAITVLIRESGW
jgi:putative peptide zinc metalloprotease protein